jgi:hypothetical protein
VVLSARGSQYWDGLCTHNPTVHRFGKRYYLYYMGNTGDGKITDKLNFTHRNNQRIGVALADRPEGPWKRSDHPLIDVTPNSQDALCLNNPSVTEMPDGRYLMIYKAVGNKNPLPFGGPVVHLAAIAKTPEGPFTKYPKPLFTKEGIPFAAEDPFIWRQNDRYWAIVKDMKGYFTGAGRSLALFESNNGLDWRPAAHPLVAKTEVRLADGTMLKLHALERPRRKAQPHVQRANPAQRRAICGEPKVIATREGRRARARVRLREALRGFPNPKSKIDYCSRMTRCTNAAFLKYQESCRNGRSCTPSGIGAPFESISPAPVESMMKYLILPVRVGGEFVAALSHGSSSSHIARAFTNLIPRRPGALAALRIEETKAYGVRKIFPE